jgi:hypothetical protein
MNAPSSLRRVISRWSMMMLHSPEAFTEIGDSTQTRLLSLYGQRSTMVACNPNTAPATPRMQDSA